MPHSAWGDEKEFVCPTQNDVIRMPERISGARTTSLPLEKIARLAGFEHPEYMSVVFKRETGDTPGHYRAGEATYNNNSNNTN